VTAPELVPDEVLFTVPETEPQTLEDTIAAAFSLEVIERQPLVLLGARIVRLRIPDQRDVSTVVAALAADPRVAEPQPNYVYHKQQGVAPERESPIAGQDLSMQYALVKLGAVEALTLADGSGTRVAIIDSGIERDHDDLKAATVEEFDAVAKDARRQPAPPLKDPHGTAIAGIIAAKGVTYGIAPKSRLLSVRAFSSGIAGEAALATTMRILRGLDWAIAQRARVINMSFAGPKDRYLERAIAATIARGGLVVAAAGNGGERAGPAYPAAYDKVIAVTAIDTDDKLYRKANRGDYVTVAAPGVDIFAPALKNAHDIHSGTSFAAAYVSGVLALMLEREPDLTLDAARLALAKAAQDLGAPGPDPEYGAGLINAWSALDYRQKQLASAKPR
jgi:subtilisin family serine protease